MTPPLDDAAQSEKFGIGQAVPRKEDPTLLQGRGRYTDDVNVPGQAYAVMVRSNHAHGVLRGIDTAAAHAMPGVLAVFTEAEMTAGGFTRMHAMPVINGRDGTPMRRPHQTPLARGKVLYVGHPLAVVVAETRHQARDAAELVVADIDPLPAVTSARAAAQPGAPQLWDDVPGNLALDFAQGDPAAAAAAFAQAAHVVRLEMPNNRIVVMSLEPRAAIGEYDAASGRYTLHAPTQGVWSHRTQIAAALEIPVEKLRILTGNVGGSFGMKFVPFPEYFSVLFAARALGRPVKWTDLRSESFLSDSHGRDHAMTAELALDRDGHFLAIRVTGYGNLGAMPSNSTFIPPTTNIAKNMLSVYRTPVFAVETRCFYSNTTAVGAYRGAGRPEANYYMERLIDTAAREMGIDRVELRRRNHVPAAAIPYKTPAGTVYDSGDFAGLLDQALAAADWDGFPARLAASRARGRLRGRGIGQYLEVTAPPGPEMGGIRFDDDGGVTIVTGTLDYGQGHASPFAQVLVATLGIPFDRIRLLQGDSDALIAGGGTGGSKSIMHSGGAIIEAGAAVIEKGRQAAAFVLEAAVADIEFGAGRFHVAGTDRGIGILELQARLREGGLPEGVPASLSVQLVHKQTHSAYPNGCHIAELEVDPETGIVEIDRYVMVNDFGTLINPLLVEGQAQGGVVQGIGQALFERVVYDEAGQPMTGSLMDYALPRAGDAPSFAPMGNHPTRARTNALGAKGCGEAGCAGSLPAVMNALVDALAPLGITHIDMPATPEVVWRAIHGREGQGR